LARGAQDFRTIVFVIEEYLNSHLQVLSNRWVQRITMSFFRSSNKENTLPAPSEPPKRTGKRHTIDWHLNPDPVDGQIRQGTKKERLERDTNHRPVHLVPSLFALIRGLFI
jgi:hypothetical protein